MRIARLPILLAGLVVICQFLSISAQEPAKKVEPKTTTKADLKLKGYLPPNWSKLGLTEEQRDKVYEVQAKYNEEIDLLEAKVKALKSKMAKERFEVLTAEQQKLLADILLKKAGGGEM